MRTSPENTVNGRRRPMIFAARTTCAVLLAVLVGCASTQRQAGTGEYIDDSVITGKVKASVFNDPALKSTEINVETFKGSVQMTGFVESQADIDKAMVLARGVPGVTNVKNGMRVKGTQ